MGIVIKIGQDGRIELKGQKLHLQNLNAIQAQCVLLKLDCEPDALFEALYAFEEYGTNETDLGITGGFIFSTYKGVVQ